MLREKENNVEQENVSVLKELCATGPYLGQISRIFWRIFHPPGELGDFPTKKISFPSR